MSIAPRAIDVERMRKAWRDERSPSLERRRRIALLSSVGLVDFAIISLYQLGVIRSLPEPTWNPGGVFDSNRVNASHKAYAHGVPDGTTGALLYSLNLVLAGAGGTRDTGRHPVFSLFLAGAVGAGVLASIQYLYDMAFKQQRACPYCIAGAILNFTMLPSMIPEVADSLKELRETSSIRHEVRQRLKENVESEPGPGEAA